MKKIALMVNSLGFGGAERVISELSVALADKGYEVHLFVLDDAEVVYPYGGTLHRISFFCSKNSFLMTLFTLQHLILMRHYKKKLKIDVSISALDFLNLYNLLTPCGDRRIPTMHNYFLQCEMTPSFKDNLIENLFSKLVHTADSVVTVSKTLQKKTRELYPKMPPEKLLCIYNASDIERIRQMAEEKPSDRLCAFTGPKTFINVVRLSEQKSVHKLLIAFAAVCEKHSDAKLVLVGDGHLRDKLRSLSRKLGISKNVLFTGFVKNPFALMARCRSFVFSSHFEGFGNVLVEAMCCGVSVISVDCLCGPREILDPDGPSVNGVVYGEYGILTTPHDGAWTEEPEESTEALAEAMEKILTDDDLHSHYCQKSAERAMDFSGEKIYQQWFDLIEGEPLE